MTTRIRTHRPLVLIGALVAVLIAALVGSTHPASAATPSCALTWGSLDRSGSAASPGGSLVDVRAGEQPCYDRLVLDIAGTPASGAWHVGYVDRVTADPSGAPVLLRGGARLLITVQAPGGPAYRPADRSQVVDVAGYRTFRQVAWVGDFEGVSSIGLGVRARLPFRVLTLPGVPGSPAGTRVVVDVAHSW
jgi:hypothetical protein